jgi:hypothetical protein
MQEEAATGRGCTTGAPRLHSSSASTCAPALAGAKCREQYSSTAAGSQCKQQQHGQQKLTVMQGSRRAHASRGICSCCSTASVAQQTGRPDVVDVSSYLLCTCISVSKQALLCAQDGSGPMSAFVTAQA